MPLKKKPPPKGKTGKPLVRKPAPKKAPAKPKVAAPKKGPPKAEKVAPEILEVTEVVEPTPTGVRELRVTPEGIVLSRVEYNREGVIVKILD